MPRKLTMLKPSGTAISWGHNASLGFFARDAKSGAFLRYKATVSCPPAGCQGRGIRDKRRHVAHARHEVGYHSPTKGRAMNLRRLPYNGTYTVGLDDAPYEERDASDGNNDGLQSEEVSDFVDRHPDGW